MKRVLLIAVITIFTASFTQAQIIQSKTETRVVVAQGSGIKTDKKYPCYQGEFNLGYVTKESLFVETVHGARVNKYFFAGIGIGTKYSGEITLKEKMDKYSTVCYKDLLFVPVYLNLKGYYPVTEKFHPYVNLSLGYAASPYEFNGLYGGFYNDFGLGFTAKVFNFGFGLQHQSARGFWLTKYINNSFYIKLGLKW